MEVPALPVAEQFCALCAEHFEEWWDCAMECYCYLRKVHDKMADGKTASEKRYGKTFDGPSIPFETLVEYIPITAKRTSQEIHQFGQKTLKGRF